MSKISDYLYNEEKFDLMNDVDLLLEDNQKLLQALKTIANGEKDNVIEFAKTILKEYEKI